jgi:ABC-type spermidine/putrescine transport system permease subunit II
VIAEAVDAAIAVGWALLVWVVLLAAFATAALYTLVVAVACAVLAVRRGVVAALSLVQHSSGPEVARVAPGPAGDRTARPAPAWARTDKDAA